MQTDFLALYRELGIEPDCTVDEMRLAYRRRVADLHPDRVGAAGEDALKTLNLRYAAALDFHRHHGRLPGAAPTTRVARPALKPAGRAQRVEAAETLPEQPQRQAPSKVVVYGIMVLAMLLVWWLSRADPGSLGFHIPGIAANKRQVAHHSDIALRLGMRRQEVVALLGEPVTRELGDTHWLYGPSWVRFECDRVSDWYSSLLKPLKASRARPPREGAAAASMGAYDCRQGAGGASRSQYR